jgi:hypothetical protein
MVSPAAESPAKGTITRFLQASADWLLGAPCPRLPLEADVEANLEAQPQHQPQVQGLEVQDANWAEWDRARFHWDQGHPPAP